MSAEERELEIGDMAPDFCLPDMENESACLADFGGKWVVLYFYPKDDTPGCTMEAVHFTRALDDYAGLNAVIVGVSTDTVESHCRFAEKHDLKVNLLSDVEHEVAEAYGAWRPKKLFGREFLGVVRSTYLIDPEGRIAHIWPRVQVRGHVEEVRQKLEGLQEGGG
jgi:peroxiredoxin Q/BCP